ncbi:LysM peptidoglycan-binding domain-containing protein [Enterococcus sp.]|jgi:LysM repeat protein|uniref:aggregation-promoting factor n=1 Tax=Enterococcus sp. TaxID=35783 RepID=UPI0025BD37CD|nr:LysM peptidoglycan-binding domain-containing protein [Enterococcus sp.]
MKSLKTVLLSTAVLAGLGVFLGGQDAFADEEYTVQSGDTLSTIAYNYFGTSEAVDKIVEANGITDKNLIYVGETLVLPTDDASYSNENSSAAAEQSTYQAPASQPASQPASSQQTSASTSASSSAATGSEASAKEWIANKESGGSYTATNGQYYGRYQLTNSYLNGDYSAANQEKVADNYVASRYGSWSAAKAFWEANGWY